MQNDDFNELLAALLAEASPAPQVCGDDLPHTAPPVGGDDLPRTASPNAVLNESMDSLDARPHQHSADFESLLEELGAGAVESPARDAAEACSEPPSADFAGLLDELIEEGDEDDSPVQQASNPREHSCSAESEKPKKRRGRPAGTYGSQALRAVRARLQPVQAVDSSMDTGPVPGSIAYARAVRLQKYRKSESDDEVPDPCSAVVKTLGCPQQKQEWQSIVLPGIGGQCWQLLKQVAEDRPLFQALVSTAATASAEPTTSLDGTDKCLQLLFQHGRHVVPSAQMAEQCEISKTQVASLLQAGAAAAVEGGRCLWGALMHAITRKIESGQWHGLLLCHRARYDETPTLTRLHQRHCQEGASDSSQHGKVVQAEGSVHLLLSDSGLLSGVFFHFLVSGLLLTGHPKTSYSRGVDIGLQDLKQQGLLVTSDL